MWCVVLEDKFICAIYCGLFNISMSFKAVVNIRICGGVDDNNSGDCQTTTGLPLSTLTPFVAFRTNRFLFLKLIFMF